MLFLRFLIFFLSFFSLVMEKDEKLVLTQKQIILTSKLRAEHPFSGLNTHQIDIIGVKDQEVILFVVLMNKYNFLVLRLNNGNVIISSQ